MNDWLPESTLLNKSQVIPKTLSRLQKGNVLSSKEEFEIQP